MGGLRRGSARSTSRRRRRCWRSWGHNDPANVLSADRPLPACAFDRLRCPLQCGDAMTRHSGASGKPARSRRPKSSKSKSRTPTKAASSRSSRSGAAAEVVQLRQELHEALEQQTATSEVLRVISRSTGDLQSVFDAMLENAARICHAKFGNIFRVEGDALYLMATHNTPPALAEARRREPVRPDPNGPFGRMLRTRTVAHIADAAV